MKKLFSNEHVIFLHVPKAGGTTFRQIIDSQYNFIERFEITDATYYDEKLNNFINLPQSKRDSIKCLKGNFHFGLHNYFSNKSVYITILRNPIDRIISYYYYLRRRKNQIYYNIVQKMDLKTFVNSKLNLGLYNAQTRLISGKRELWGKDVNNSYNNLTKKDLEVAIENINDHFLIAGITEMYDETLFLVKQKLGWDTPLYVRKNTSNNRPARQEVSQDIINIIKENNQLDMKLYNYVKNLFLKKFEQLDKSSLDEFKKFCAYIDQYKYSIPQFDNYDKFINVELINFLIKNKTQSFIIFGAGESGEIVYKFIKEFNDKLNCNIKIKYFLDNDKNKWGKQVCKKIIMEPKLENLEGNHKIIIASKNFGHQNSIAYQILDMEIDSQKIIIGFSRP